MLLLLLGRIARQGRRGPSSTAICPEPGSRMSILVFPCPSSQCTVCSSGFFGVFQVCWNTPGTVSGVFQGCWNTPGTLLRHTWTAPGTPLEHSIVTATLLGYEYSMCCRGMSALWMCCRGMHAAEADLLYLQNASKLALYGVHLHSALVTFFLALSLVTVALVMLSLVTFSLVSQNSRERNRGKT